jgi:hypothetical protein
MEQHLQAARFQWCCVKVIVMMIVIALRVLSANNVIPVMMYLDALVTFRVHPTFVSNLTRKHL